MEKQFLNEEVIKRWEPVLESGGEIKDKYRRLATIIALENTYRELKESTSSANTLGLGAGGTQHGVVNPVLISMIRRTVPSLIAHDLVGVQPMTGPTGLVFVMRAQTSGATPQELFTQTDPANINTAPKQTVDVAETLAGPGSANPFNEVEIVIDKVSVEAQTRALKARYTVELEQDLKAIHGLDAASELSTILSAEVTAEINRELVNTLYTIAKPATGIPGLTAAGAAATGFAVLPAPAAAPAANATANAGSNKTVITLANGTGRWAVERYKELYVYIVKNAAEIARETRRGMGNKIICSASVAAALENVATLTAPGVENTPAGGFELTPDFTTATYIGRLGGRFDVYVDPYLGTNDILIGYKGTSPYDAGYFYCPYVPLQFMKATGEEDFQPRIGVKTRYGVVQNPLFQANAGDVVYAADAAGNVSVQAIQGNAYYRIATVADL